MSPKHFFFSPEHGAGVSNLNSRTGGEAITVTRNQASDLHSQEVFVGISMDFSSADRGEAWAALDANELRDALDKAVGPREEPEPWEGRKPYRPIDRDRLLRHIEDLEATLTRRNERHGRDQERIRELEGLLARQEAEVYDLQQPKTAREYLELAWEAAIVPEDGKIHEGEESIGMWAGDGRAFIPIHTPAATVDANTSGIERRLLDPRSEPSKEDSYRKELEGKGLVEWEIQALIAAQGAA